jgi:beta-N-acetylhexosaminidase
VVEAVKGVDIVIIGTINVDAGEAQAKLVQALHEAGHTPIVVALRTPYDLIFFPTVETYLCAYSIRPVTMEAIARVLFGEIAAKGVLPCSLPNLELPR